MYTTVADSYYELLFIYSKAAKNISGLLLCTTPASSVTNIMRLVKVIHSLREFVNHSMEVFEPIIRQHALRNSEHLIIFLCLLTLAPRTYLARRNK